MDTEDAMSEFDYSDPISFLAAFIMFIIGVFGTVCNFLMMKIFLKDRSGKTAFDYIGFYRAVSNFLILTGGFLFTFLPKTLLGFSLYPPFVESIIVHSSGILYFGSEYLMVIVALNRFCAVFFPMQYSQIFAIPQTILVLSLMYIYQLVSMAYKHIPRALNGCYDLFSTKLLTWHFDSSPQCSFHENAFTAILYTFIGICVLNAITLVKLIMYYKKKTRIRSENQIRQKMRKNSLLFLQMMLQDSVYVIDLAFFFELSSWSTDRAWTYVSGNFIWESLHAVDGFIMLMFNEKFTCCKKKVIKSPVVSVTSKAG